MHFLIPLVAVPPNQNRQKRRLSGTWTNEKAGGIIWKNGVAAAVPEGRKIMDTIKMHHRQVRFIAHRGLSGLERENTAAAFVAAGNRSYYGIETDVHRTADGEFIIVHDDTTGRVTVGADLTVEETAYADLRQLRLPDLDGKTREDLCLPSLAEYIRICKKYEKIAVLELKNPFTPTDIEKIVKIIREETYLEQVIFISFSLENCLCLRKMLPDQPIQWLIGREIDEDVVETLVTNHLDLDAVYIRLTRELVERLHGLGITVNCWTCNDPAAGEALIEMGVDFITTNILE